MHKRLICVIGGGIGGLVFAALHRANGGEILVLERENIDAAEEDGKSVVVNAASAALLRKAGVNLEDAAPLSCARIQFQNAPGGATIDGDGALGFGIAHRAVRKQLAEIAGDSFRAPVAVLSVKSADAGARVSYRTADGEEKTVSAAAVVVACALPDLPPPFAVREFDYRQAAISFTAEARNFPRGLAVESFTRFGIVALVPRVDKKIGVILCAESDAAGMLSALPDDALLAKINDCFGGEFALHSAGARFIYAPKARRVSPLAAENIAMSGAGATILHPAGAQGLNLGIADAACLSELLHRRGDSGDSIAAAFAAYRRRRTPAHRATLAATSILAAGGHLRFAPFRLAGGAATAVLSAAAFPFRKSLSALLSGERNPQKTE
ncbi:MAG: FAD-dependent monooxygenase [Gammaproteobacteria bacterium]